MKAAFVFLTSLVASSSFVFAAPSYVPSDVLVERGEGGAGGADIAGVAVDAITAGIDLVKGILDQVHQDKLVRSPLEFPQNNSLS